MVAVPAPTRTTASEIYAWYQQRKEDFRDHLGASLIGHHCDRYLWLTFRWVELPQFNGRLLRVFSTGNREEPRVHEELRGIGVELHVEEDGKQIRCSDETGHFGGSVDGIGLGFPEGPKTWAVLEIKTHSSKSWNDVRTKTVKESKPQHYAQMQTYMGLLKLDRAMYFAVNKDTDEIYNEWVHFDRKVFESLMDRAKRTINATTPPSRISDDPANWQCKMCDFYKFCHHEGLPAANCRTCSHSTPVDKGMWKCSLHNKWLTGSEQRKGCDSHIFIPPLVPANPIDGGENYVEYQAKDGTTFKNGPGYETSEALLKSAKAATPKRKKIGDNDGVPFDDEIPF